MVDLGSGMSQLTSSFTGMGVNIVYWLGWFLLLFLVMGGFLAVFYLMTFKIKAETWELYGSGKEGVLAIGKKKGNRLRWVKQKSAWRALFPLFNKKDIEPFDSEFIYPGKQIYAFKLNDAWIPGRININKDGEELKTEINPVPYYIRNWQSIQHKRNAQEFAEHNFWEDNKYFFMTIITAGLCLVMVGLTVYFTYQFATGGTGAMNGLASAINNFGVIQ